MSVRLFLCFPVFPTFPFRLPLPCVPSSKYLCGHMKSAHTPLVKAFEILCGEMQKKWNPAPERKKSSWFSWGS